MKTRNKDSERRICMRKRPSRSVGWSSKAGILWLMAAVLALPYTVAHSAAPAQLAPYCYVSAGSTRLEHHRHPSCAPIEHEVEQPALLLFGGAPFDPPVSTLFSFDAEAAAATRFLATADSSDRHTYLITGRLRI